MSLIVAACLTPGLAAGEWLGLPYRLSDAGTFVRYEPYLLADRHGSIHLFWSQDSAQHCCSGEDQFSLLRYARFRDGIWQGPVDLVRVTGGRIDAASACVDGTDRLHLAWVQNGQAGSLHYSSAAIADALQSDRWSTPTELAIEQPRTNRIRLRADSTGNLHLMFSRTSGTKGLFYTRSSDSGVHWSEPVQLDPDIPADFTPQIFQSEIDDRDGLHAVWNDYGPSADSQVVSRWLRYSHSFDGGSTWSAPTILDEFDPSGDPLTQSTRSPHGIAFTGDQVHIVWTGGPPGAPTGVGRKYRVSPDRGVTWGDIATNIFDAWGEQNGDGLATDSSGVVHWVGLVRKFVGPGQLWEGLWGADWSGAWSEPTQVVTRLSPGIDSPRLASTPGGQRVAAFRSSPDSETGLRYLFATNDSGPAFYFPHYGDGQGLSMQVAINNPSDQTASGRLAVYDQAGDPQELPFADLGSMSSVDLSIPPKSTRVLTTLGTSDPVRVGFIRVELDQPEASGVAIFRYASGPEASVLPSSPGRRFALFVERSDRLRTGIALARLSPNQPVSLALYSLDGTLVESRDYAMAATQEAKFVDELLDVPSEFQGLLVIESPALLTAVGLRFGNGVLSTIPIVDLDSQESARSAFLFPHYGDGSGLSMQFAVNNLNASSAATGLLSILAFDGSPQELPLDDGSHSEVSLHLAPHATEVLESRGTSIPPRTGFVSVESDQPGISGVAIFKYASGPEASVLPSHYGKRFVLFAQRSASLRTGIALVRAGSDNVTLSLYNDQGTLVGSRPFEFSPGGRQGARFLSEAFTDLPQDFSGLLILESDADFAAIGLRFGGGVLSTIPVTPLE